MEEQKPIIKVENVSKSFRVYLDKGRSLKEKILFWKRNRYENRLVLDNVSFEVKKGESVGLIGRNGCGKSTMLKMLTQIYYPNKGKITVNGRVSSLIELGAGFHPDMSGRENIYINASIYGLTRKEIDSRIDSIIEFSELKDFIDNPIRTYSSGMYMRLAFSVAISVDADVLLIDEILAVGDANFQAKCFNKLKELRAKGITIVLVTHSMQSILDFCDKCIWIEKGKIMGDGVTDEITTKYIKYMFDEKILKSLNEQDRNSIKLEVQRREEKDKAKELEAKKLEENQKQLELKKRGLDFSQNHFGIGGAKINEVTILDSKKRKTKVIKSNESIYIKIKYQIEQNFNKKINFCIGINSVDQKTFYFGSNTKLEVKNPKINKNGDVIFCADKFPLGTGMYSLCVSILLDDDTPVDYYKSYLNFEVVSIEKSVGCTIINHNWLIK